MTLDLAEIAPPEPVEHGELGHPVADRTHRLMKNIGALFGAQMVTWTMTLLWTLIVPRIIGPRGLGIINTAVSVSGVLGVFFGLATSTYLVREIVMRPERSERLVGTAIVLKLMLAPLPAVGAFLFVRVAGYDHAQAIAIYLAAGTSVAMLIADAQGGAFQAHERMQYLAYGAILNKTGQSLVGILVAVVGLGAIGVVANMTAVAIVLVVVQFVWLRRFMRIDFRTTPRQVSRMAKSSFPFLASGLFFTFYLWIDTVLLSLMTSARVVGWYSAATTLVTTFMFLPIVLQTSWLPRFVSAFKHDPDDLYPTARIPIELLVVLAAPITAGLIIGAKVMMTVLYGSAFLHAVPVMMALAFCIVPTYFNMMMTQVFIAAGRQRVSMWIMIGAATVNPLLNVVLIPLWQAHFHDGATGAAVALDLTEILMAIVNFAILGRRIFNRSAYIRSAKALAAGAAMCLVGWLLRPVGEIPALAGSGVALVHSVIALGILTQDDKTFLRGLLTRLSRPLRRKAPGPEPGPSVATGTGTDQIRSVAIDERDL